MSPHIKNMPKAQILAALRQQLHTNQQSGSLLSRKTVSTGCARLDDLFPAGGIQRGQLAEWLTPCSGSGAGLLSLSIAWRAIDRQHSAIVVVDREKWFYPPALVGWDVNLRNLVVLRPTTKSDELWALDQSLRCPAVAAVWSWLPCLDSRDFRRLQLAAEQGGTLGLLLRPATVRGQPSWSGVQLLVEPQAAFLGTSANSAGNISSHFNSDSNTGAACHHTFTSPPHQHTTRCWKITLLRCRTGASGKSVTIQMHTTTGKLALCSTTSRQTESNHEAHSLSLVSQLAHPKITRRQSRT